MTPCKLGQILDATTPAELEALRQAIADQDKWPAKSLARAVNTTRFSIGATTIKEHRRQTCGCFE